MMRRGEFVLLALALALGAPGAARAEDAAKNQGEAACSRFSWPIERERAWFSANLESTPSGARLAETREAILLDLAPTNSIRFVLTPERAPKPDSFSGDVIIAGVAAPGVYQITLSDEAWIDVFENDARLKSTAFTGQKECPGVRKSVRFELTPGAPITVQISNSAKKSIKLAIAPAS
ncbi:MAG TPA: hypothetical protein VEK35_01860 [Roseiarcus sp.]|nr:hypothetical protein [Roseiarcus sp.]